MARPTDYSQEILDRSNNYLTDCEATNKLPSVAGLSLFLDVARSTVYLWAKTHPEFSDNLEKILSTQEILLIDGGIKGNYNSTITKLMLTKHGYSDKQETDVTSGGEKLQLNIINYGDTNGSVQVPTA